MMQGKLLDILGRSRQAFMPQAHRLLYASNGRLQTLGPEWVALVQEAYAALNDVTAELLPRNEFGLAQTDQADLERYRQLIAMIRRYGTQQQAAPPVPSDTHDET